MLYFIAIALLSAATILLELALLRLFAIQQFYHFAFMAISLALLGAGASGSILTLRRRRLPAVGLCLAFSLTTLGAYLVINYLPFDSFSIAWDSRQLLFLVIYFLVIAIPFLFAGLLVGGELMAAGRGMVGGGAASHQVYGANLIGSALGGLASLLVLGAVGGEGAIVVVVIAGGVAGLLFGFARSSTGSISTGSIGGGRRSAGSLSSGSIGLGAAVLVVVLGMGALLFPPALLAQRLSPYKTLSILSQALDAEHTVTAEDATARVDVVESGTIHMMPGLSLLAPVSLPTQVGLMLDGDNLMPITGLDPDSEQARLLAAHRPEGIATLLRPGARTLIIEAGTGMEALFALAGGAERVTVAEENGLIMEVMKGEYADFSAGLYNDARVTTVAQSGRVFARRQQGDGYGVAIVALTDPHRPVTSGAYSLTEDYTHTVEAFGDYLATLAEDGLLVVTRWAQTPPSESVRTFGALAEALAAQGLDPGEHLLAFRTVRTMTIVAGRSPFSAAEIEMVGQFLSARSFDAVYWPGIEATDLNRFNVLDGPVYHDLMAAILADAQGVYEDYRFDIRPPTDDRPFFLHYFKWRQSPEILATLGLTWQPFGGSGYFVLVALLILVSLAAALFIIGPLLLRRCRNDSPSRSIVPYRFWRGRVLVYFGCLGLAFLFVEVPLAQRFILVLDQPVTALAVVLGALLLFSGLGSLTVPRWRMPVGLGLLIGLIVLYPLLLGPLSELALGLPAGGRIGLTVAIIAPLGYLMGLPFAGGLRVVEVVEPGLVPWAWAINGSFSVISSVLAVMVALSLGFSAVLWLGAAAYAGALVSFAGIWREEHRLTLPRE